LSLGNIGDITSEGCGRLPKVLLLTMFWWVVGFHSQVIQHSLKPIDYNFRIIGSALYKRSGAFDGPHHKFVFFSRRTCKNLNVMSSLVSVPLPN